METPSFVLISFHRSTKNKTLNCVLYCTNDPEFTVTIHDHINVINGQNVKGQMGTIDWKMTFFCVQRANDMSKLDNGVTWHHHVTWSSTAGSCVC